MWDTNVILKIVFFLSNWKWGCYNLHIHEQEIDGCCHMKKMWKGYFSSFPSTQSGWQQTRGTMKGPPRPNRWMWRWFSIISDLSHGAKAKHSPQTCQYLSVKLSLGFCQWTLKYFTMKTTTCHSLSLDRSDNSNFPLWYILYLIYS